MSNILITHRDLNELGGSQTFTYTLAKALKKAGHAVQYSTPKDGLVGKKLQEIGINPQSRKTFDLVICQHFRPTSKEARGARTVQIIHGLIEAEKPLDYIDEYFVISQEIKEVLKEETTLINNIIDFERFKIDKPINNKLQTVLSLCQGRQANNLVKQVCQDMGLNFLSKSKWNNGIFDIENEINKADLVVSYGRGVYEALACGRPVVVFDSRNYTPAYSDGLIQREHQILESMKNNCSGRRFKMKFTRQALRAEFERYDSKFSEGYAAFARREFDPNNLISKLLG